MDKHYSVCPYCGTGCSMVLYVDSNKIIKVEGNKDSPVNRGMLCIKGSTVNEFVQHPDRLKKPLIRKDGRLVEVEWGEAIRYVAKSFKRVLNEHGPRSFSILNSARCTNEENFLMYELANKVLKTQNIDQCARLCHMPSGIAYSKMFGIGAMSASYQNLEKSKVIMICGANPAEQHPIIFSWIMSAKKKGAKIIVIDPRRSSTAKQADIYISIEEGKDDAFFIALCKYLVQNGMVDWKMLERCEDYEFFLEELKPLGNIKELCEYCNVDEKYVKEICDLISKGPTTFINGLGLTESAGCVTNVELVGCLALLTGNIGKEGAGVAPLRGQNNVQGATDMQTMYYRKLRFDGKTKACYLDKIFDRSLSSTEMMEAALNGQVKCMYIMGENIAMSHPNASMTIEALKALDFLVVQDIFMTETAEFAHAVLPGASFAEKTGTFTNAERRVQLIHEAVRPIGKPDWEIICLIARAMENKKDFSYKHPKEIFENIKKHIDLYSGLTYEAMEKFHGVQFPCFRIREGKQIFCNEDMLYKSFFYRKSGKAIFPAVSIYPPSMKTNGDFPFRLITAGVLAQYQTGTMTRRCKTLNKIINESFVGVNAEDAKEMGIKTGDMLEISAPNGKSITAKAKISDEVKRRYVFMPVNFWESRVNMLTSEKLIDISKTPEYKGAIVNIKKV